jgi:hypothetical protein
MVLFIDLFIKYLSIRFALNKSNKTIIVLLSYSYFGWLNHAIYKTFYIKYYI